MWYALYIDGELKEIKKGNGEGWPTHFDTYEKNKSILIVPLEICGFGLNRKDVQALVVPIERHS